MVQVLISALFAEMFGFVAAVVAGDVGFFFGQVSGACLGICGANNVGENRRFTVSSFGFLVLGAGAGFFSGRYFDLGIQGIQQQLVQAAASGLGAAVAFQLNSFR